MPIIYYASKEIRLESFDKLEEVSSTQYSLRGPNCCLLDKKSIESHLLKKIIHAVDYFTSDFATRIHDYSVDFIPNIKCYILSKGDNLLVFCNSIITIAETGKRVGFSYFKAELELQDNDVIMKNQLQQLDFADGSSVTVKQSSIVDSSAVFAKPFSIMVQLHEYMGQGSNRALKALQTSCKAATAIEVQALIQCLKHEIAVEAKNTDIPQRELFKKHFIQLLAIIPSIVVELNKTAFYKKENTLLKECYDQFCMQHPWSLVIAAGLTEKYATEKYNLRYIFSNFISLLLPLIAVAKLHMMQYCIMHIPALLAFACGVSLTYSYIAAIAAVVSLATILLSYGFLKYLADRAFLKSYGTDKYIVYKTFCYNVKILTILDDLGRSLNTIIREKINSIHSYINGYYTLTAGQDINEILELKESISQYDLMKNMQWIMLVSSLLCLLLPAYQLVCGITMLLGYIAFSCSLVTPNNTKIILATGSVAKAEKAINLFSCATPATRAYACTAEFLGYSNAGNMTKTSV
jgi:hypothetical protein